MIILEIVLMNKKYKILWGGKDDTSIPRMGFCFVAGTKVLITDGSTKNIEDIELGDVVQSWNEISGEVENSKVVKLIQSVHDDMVVIRFSNDVVNENTFDHPYYVKDKGWCSHSPELTKERYDTDTELLEVRDVCYYNNDRELEEVEISFIKENRDEVQTYIFKLDNNYTFFANGILTHNKEGGACFISDQKISMFDGTYKKISVIKIGDIIKVYDENTNTVKSGQVNKIQTKLHDDAYELYLENGKILKPTGNHPFLEKNKGWVTIDGHNPNHAGGSGHLDIGNYVTDIKDGLVKVIDIVKIDGEHLTYNFIDMECGTIIADDIITHNSLELSSTVVSGSSLMGSSSIQTHENMSVGDTVLAASIEGLPDTDVAAEFLLWEYTGSDIASQITLVTSSIESITTSSHQDFKLIETPGKSEPLKISDSHPLLAKSESIWAFEYVGDIDASYKLVSSSLEEVDITSITEVTGSLATGSFRRFDIEPQDTYFADGILVHN